MVHKLVVKFNISVICNGALVQRCVAYVTTVAVLNSPYSLLYSNATLVYVYVCTLTNGTNVQHPTSITNMQGILAISSTQPREEDTYAMLYN